MAGYASAASFRRRQNRHIGTRFVRGAKGAEALVRSREEDERGHRATAPGAASGLETTRDVDGQILASDPPLPQSSQAGGERGGAAGQHTGRSVSEPALATGVDGVLLRRVRDHGKAEDLTQEVFLRMLDDTPYGQPPDGYIFRIARNLLIDASRRSVVRDRHRKALSADTDRAKPTRQRSIAWST